MKRLLLACAVLAFVGPIGNASADPITVTNIEIWNAVTTGDNAGSPRQQALPTNPLTGTTPLANVTGANLAPDGAISLNIGNPPPPAVGSSSTIGAFLLTDPDINTSVTTGAPTPCGSGCQATILSTLNFSQVTLFKFTFTVPNSESPNNTFTGSSDDGESLFLDSGGSPTGSNLFPAGSSDPRFEGTDMATLIPGDTYDLYYVSANGNPETLITSLTSHPVDAPEPTSLALLGSALVGLGLFYRRRRSTIAG